MFLEVVFNNKKLEQLYKTGKSSKYKLDSHIIKYFFEVVAILESSENIYDLQNSHGLNFEKLSGYQNRFSVRLNIKWRLEMTIEWKNSEKTIGIIGIEDISNHYGG